MIINKKKNVSRETFMKTFKLIVSRETIKKMKKNYVSRETICIKLDFLSILSYNIYTESEILWKL